MKSTYTSDELFHFVGHRSPNDDEANYQMLLTVLRSGRISHSPHEDNAGKISTTYDPSGRLVKENLIRPTVICFCDIPRNHLDIHLQKYGKFGLSFSRTLLIKHGARPVTYVPYSKTDKVSIYGGNMLDHWEAVYRGIREHLFQSATLTARESRGYKQQPDSAEAAVSALRSVFEKDFLAFIKPFNADLADSDDNNYYLEREWRKYQNMDANPETVNAVWVAEGYEDRFRKQMPQFAEHVQGIS